MGHSPIHLLEAVSVSLNYQKTLTSMGTFVQCPFWGCCQWLAWEHSIILPLERLVLVNQTNLNNHWPAWGHSSIAPLDATFSKSKLSWTIADVHGDTHPLLILRLLSVSLNIKNRWLAWGNSSISLLERYLLHGDIHSFHLLRGCCLWIKTNLDSCWSMGHSPIVHSLEAAVSDSKLSWTITDQLGVTLHSPYRGCC